MSGWGKVGWIKPRGGELPLLGAMLDGQSDAADHWAHMILNHEPGDPYPKPDEVGIRGRATSASSGACRWAWSWTTRVRARSRRWRLSPPS